MIRKREYKNSQGQQIWGYDFWYQGKRYRRAEYTTKAEADIAEHRAKQLVYSGKTVLRPTTVKELADAFLAHREGRVASNTFSREQNRLLIIVRALGNLKPSMVTKADIEKYLDDRIKAGRVARTINLETTLLRSLFAYAVENSYAHENPVIKVRKLKTVQVEPRIPTIEEFRALVEGAKKTEPGLQLATWILLRGYCGTRPTEAYFLEWKDIDFDKGLVTVRPKDGNMVKNRKARSIPMHSELRVALLEWRQEWEKLFAGKRPPHDWVFVNHRHPERRCERFEKTFYRAQKLAGLTDKITPHALRHFFISQAVMSGVSMMSIARCVGHSSFQMIEKVYAHLSPTYMKNEIEKIQFGTGNSNAPTTPTAIEPEKPSSNAPKMV